MCVQWPQRPLGVATVHFISLQADGKKVEGNLHVRERSWFYTMTVSAPHKPFGSVCFVCTLTATEGSFTGSFLLPLLLPERVFRFFCSSVLCVLIVLVVILASLA